MCRALTLLHCMTYKRDLRKALKICGGHQASRVRLPDAAIYFTFPPRLLAGLTAGRAPAPALLSCGSLGHLGGKPEAKRCVFVRVWCMWGVFVCVCVCVFVPRVRGGRGTAASPPRGGGSQPAPCQRPAPSRRMVRGCGGGSGTGRGRGEAGTEGWRTEGRKKEEAGCCWLVPAMAARPLSLSLPLPSRGSVPAAVPCR